MKKLSKEQRKELAATRRAARIREAKANIGNTIAQKLGLVASATALGAMPDRYNFGEPTPANPQPMSLAVPVVPMVLGYGLSFAMGGKAGAAGSGLADAALSIFLSRYSRGRANERRAAAGEAPLDALPAAPVVRGLPAGRSREDAIFRAGMARGRQEGVRVGVAGALRVAEAAEDDDGAELDDDEAISGLDELNAIEAAEGR